MKVGTFFVRVWRTVSILALVFVLFNSYISYPGEVAVRFDEQDQPVQFIGRETLFYLAVAIFLINNTLVNAVARLFPRIPTAQVFVPNRQAWANHRAKLNVVMTNWFYTLMASINTILALGLMVLSFLNRSARSIEPIDHAWLLPVCVAIISVVLLSLPVRLFMKPGADA